MYPPQSKLRSVCRCKMKDWFQRKGMIECFTEIWIQKERRREREKTWSCYCYYYDYAVVSCNEEWWISPFLPHLRSTVRLCLWESTKIPMGALILLPVCDLLAHPRHVIENWNSKLKCIFQKLFIRENWCPFFIYKMVISQRNL